jgi:hypothetical protein
MFRVLSQTFNSEVQSMPDETTPAADAAATPAPAAVVPAISAAKASTLNKILAQYGSLLKATAINFVQDHQSDAEILGADAVQAILQEQIANRHVTILPEINPDATVEELATFESTLEGRSAQAALIAKAIEQDAERVAKLRGDAYAIAEKIGASVVTFGAAILLHGLTAVQTA